MSPEEIQHIADAAAKKAVEQVFLGIGIDVGSPGGTLQAQQDWNAVRDFVRSFNDLKKKGTVTVWVIFLTATLGVIWAGIKESLP